MIRAFESRDLGEVMRIWLACNLQAHSFIAESYWKDSFEDVKRLLPQAEVFVYEDDGKVAGFIGLIGSDIAGLFIDINAQTGGMGKQLIAFAKQGRSRLSLRAYRRNERAVGFYLREGFRIQSEQIDAGTGESEYLMQWSLS